MFFKNITIPNEITENIIFHTYNIFIYFTLYLENSSNNKNKNLTFNEKRFIIILKNHKYDDIINIYKKNKIILLWLKKRSSCIDILYISDYKKFCIINNSDLEMISFFCLNYNIFNKPQLSLIKILHPNLLK